MTRSCILEWLIGDSYVNGDTAALLTSAVLWLAMSTPPGSFIGQLYRAVHYEITDIVDPAGRKANNFRLALGQEPDEPIPEWVHDVHSSHGKPDV